MFPWRNTIRWMLKWKRPIKPQLVAWQSFQRFLPTWQSCRYLCERYVWLLLRYNCVCRLDALIKLWWLLIWLSFLFIWHFDADWNAGSSYCCSLVMFMWRKTLPYMNKWKIYLVSSVHHSYGQQAGLAPPLTQSKGRRLCKYKQWELSNPWSPTKPASSVYVPYDECWWFDDTDLSCLLHFVHGKLCCHFPLCKAILIVPFEQALLKGL